MRNETNKSRQVMAATITLGLAIAFGTPTFAGAGSSQLRSAGTSFVRNAPTVPTQPMRVKAGQINDGRQGRSFAAPGLEGMWIGVLQNVMLALVH